MMLGQRALSAMVRFAAVLGMLAALSTTAIARPASTGWFAEGGLGAVKFLPKASADEQSARKAAIQQALRGATDVPLGVMRQSAAALDLSTAVAGHGHRAAASDVGVAVALLRAGLRGARLNVEINVGSISDGEYAGAVAAEAARVSGAASRTADEAEALL